VKDPSAKNWKEVIPHRDAVFLENVEAFRDHLAIVEREHGLRQLRSRICRPTKCTTWSSRRRSTHSTSGQSEFNTSTIRFNYSSLITPSSVFDYDMETHKRELKKQQEVLEVRPIEV